MTAQEVLQKYWGYENFRASQSEVIASVLEGKDTLAIMPTGGGKSLCFQVPALMQSGLCIVVTPLIALMKDQVANLKKRGIMSLAIHSGLQFHEVKRQFENAIHGNFKFLYVSPERLETSLFLEYLQFLDVNLIAVDEAHCISQWGYDFRPSYLRIATLREQLPDIPFLALTASATTQVQKDICAKLEFRDGYNLFTQSYNRPNLSYSVFTPPSKETKISEILTKVQGSGIAYCRTRKRTKELSELLTVSRIQSDFYHAGLTTEERSSKQDSWVHNKTRIICCTNAFGMGIDKPDVRTVVHYDMPEALENYYQEAGRAGRDGKKSYAVLLFHTGEIDELQNRIPLKFPDIDSIRKIYGSLCSYLQLPAGKGRGLSFDFEMGRFVDRFKLNPILATSVLKILEQEEVLMLSDNFFTFSTVEFFASKETLRSLEKDFPQYTAIIKGLLRSYEGIFDQPGFIDEFTLARFIGMKKEEIFIQLSELNKMQVIEYVPKSDVPKVYFLIDRVPSENLLINMRNIAERKAAYIRRLDAMIQYATQKDECRSVFINNYFGGKPVLPCGICDVCLAKNSRQLNMKELENVLTVIRANHPVLITELEKLTGLSREKISASIRFLKQENTIDIDESNKVMVK